MKKLFAVLLLSVFGLGLSAPLFAGNGCYEYATYYEDCETPPDEEQTPPTVTVPEPGTSSLLLAGVLAVWAVRRFKK